jgi:hypothetical protein
MTKTYSEHPAGLECGNGGEEEKEEQYMHGKKGKIKRGKMKLEKTKNGAI